MIFSAQIWSGREQSELCKLMNTHLNEAWFTSSIEETHRFIDKKEQKQNRSVHWNFFERKYTRQLIHTIHSNEYYHRYTDSKWTENNFIWMDVTLVNITQSKTNSTVNSKNKSDIVQKVKSEKNYKTNKQYPWLC